VFDLDAYLTRIGLRGRPTIGQVHRAHVTSIPFENLDPQQGVPVSLAPDDLQRKLVEQRRGGYCFEQNMLLKLGLEALGAEVELFLARVRVGRDRRDPGGRSHLVLGVRAEDALWHADVGFGRGTLLEPIPFGAGKVHEHSGWRFRVVQDGPELVLQTAHGENWLDLYGFVPQPVPMVDVETSNWFTSTHPRSPFVTGLVASKQQDDGTRLFLSDWSGELSLTEERPSGNVATPVDPQAVPELLDSRFGLGGFSLGSDGHYVSAA
jgi:N-hydroxyarylamine O-acetyltransferase